MALLKIHLSRKIVHATTHFLTPLSLTVYNYINYLSGNIKTVTFLYFSTHNVRDIFIKAKFVYMSVTCLQFIYSKTEI